MKPTNPAFHTGSLEWLPAAAAVLGPQQLGFADFVRQLPGLSRRPT